MNGRYCGRQRSGAPSPLERRGWTSIVQVVVPAGLWISAPWTAIRSPLGSLVLGLRCSFCPGSAPMPVLTGLHAVPPAARWSKSMPMEFRHGRPLSPEELEMLRQQIEEGYDNIAEVDDEIRGIIARNWPYLLEKLPPEDE
jgi:hypothetical protein